LVEYLDFDGYDTSGTPLLGHGRTYLNILTPLIDYSSSAQQPSKLAMEKHPFLGGGGFKVLHLRIYLQPYIKGPCSKGDQSMMNSRTQTRSEILNPSPPLTTK
jgi:hypothetical protein